MARTEILTDDLDGTTEGVTTTRWEVPAMSFEIDLNPEHAAELQAAFDVLTAYAKAGRFVHKRSAYSMLDAKERAAIKRDLHRAPHKLVSDEEVAAWLAKRDKQ